MKYMADFIEHFQKRNVFSMRDCRIFLKKKKISKGYLYFLIHYLLKKGKIKRITRGIYTCSDDPIVVGFAFSPFYYGLQQALSFHHLWGQEANLVIITPRIVRKGLRQILQSNVVVRRIDRKMFFGFDFVKHYDKWIPVSDIEKTLIDLVYFNEKISPSVLKEIKAKLRKKVLQGYLKKAPAHVKKKVNALLG